ncbi:MAG: aminotransferase class I/II-fold pyridoxal phosphate-dependent enzyme [Planctomycetaceae bacterium]
MNAGRFEFLVEKLESLRAADLFRSLVPRERRGPVLIEPDGRQLINFGSNDYLGFAGQSLSPDRIITPAQGCGLHGGAGASALVSGYTPLHEELCRLLASWEQTEAAVLFPSGYAACSGTVATLAEEGDLLLSDELNHASLIDGCRLSRATRMVYPHRRADLAKELLAAHRQKHARAWIVTDGVFGMDGDVAPLESLCELAERFDAHLIVDEAHATGVLGADGSGLCAELGVKSRVAIRIGTLSKALGSHGGFVVGPQPVIDYLINRCRPLIFSTAGSPLTIAAAARAIQVLRAEPERRAAVRNLAQSLRQQIGACMPGKVPPSDVAGVPIVPVVVGTNERVLRASAKLREEGFFVPAIRPPTVPTGTARLRLSVTSAHQPEDVEQVVRSLRDTMA